MSKLLIVIFFLAGCWAGLSAQHLLHAVYLKNGWIIRGKILVNTPDSLKIESCGNVFVFSPDEVLTIQTEKAKASEKKQDFIDNYSSKGIYNQTSFGLITGSSDAMNSPGYSLETRLGYEFSPALSIGLGTGISKYNIEVIPLFFNLKSELIQRVNAPVINVVFGYSFPMNRDKNQDYIDYHYDGGLCLGLDIGICSYRSPKRALIVSAGYCYQHIVEASKSIYWYNNSTETNTYDFNKLVVKLSFLFK